MKLIAVWILCALVVATLATDSGEEATSRPNWLRRQFKKINSCIELCGLRLFDWFQARNSKGNTRVFSSCCFLKQHNCNYNTDFEPIKEGTCKNQSRNHARANTRTPGSIPLQ